MVLFRARGHVLRCRRALIGVQPARLRSKSSLIAGVDRSTLFNSDISSTYDSIDDLHRTLISLKGSLDSDELDEEKEDRVKRCLHSCEDSLIKLSQKAQKLRKYEQPEGVRKKALAQLQRG